MMHQQPESVLEYFSEQHNLIYGFWLYIYKVHHFITFLCKTRAKSIDVRKQFTQTRIVGERVRNMRRDEHTFLNSNWQLKSFPVFYNWTPTRWAHMPLPGLGQAGETMSVTVFCGCYWSERQWYPVAPGTTKPTGRAGGLVNITPKEHVIRWKCRSALWNELAHQNIHSPDISSLEARIHGKVPDQRKVGTQDASKQEGSFCRSLLCTKIEKLGGTTGCREIWEYKS